jgi:hypothetical protein
MMNWIYIKGIFNHPFVSLTQDTEYTEKNKGINALTKYPHGFHFERAFGISVSNNFLVLCVLCVSV